LGLKTLSVIDRAVALIRRADPDFVFAVAGLDDAETYAMLARGETVGVFQLESTGMRDAVRQIGPDCIDDIIAVVALYRPGPMDNIPKYCNVKKGHEEPDYPHPDLEPILKETYGIIVYQEQVMEIAKVLSGYSLGEADLLRRAMGKKIRAEMDAQKARFVEGAEQRGIERGQAERIFELVARFADYGFNKSHAACYAVIAYQTAWLKRHHPAEFLAASMTFDMHNTDKLGVFMREAARLDVKVRGPDINRTQAEFVVEDGAIVYSLSALKNVGRAAVEHLVEVREKGGPFASIADFARRIDPHIVNRRALEAMARAGAFDALEPNRARVLAAVDAILQLAQRTREDMAVGQASLFGGDAAAAPEELPLPDVAPWDGVRKLAEEFAAVGFHLSGHPLDDFMAALKRIGVVEYAQVCERLKHEKQLAVRMAAVVTMKRERRSQSGNLYAFVGFSDPSGQFEAVCFSDVLNAHRELLEPESAVLLKVEATAENDEVKLRINGVESLTERARAIAGGLEIHLRETAGLPRIADMLQNGGKSPVRLVLHSPRLGRVDMLLGERFSVSPEIKAALKTLPGVLDVRDL
ncbi:MAG TPA: DNA polymerase III subunit alpha, partial [Thermopetrobacter sp.]|nr:DNA polymerase III subunit alpha [Thermopetrobacter sp.]